MAAKPHEIAAVVGAMIGVVSAQVIGIRSPMFWLTVCTAAIVGGVIAYIGKRRTPPTNT